MDQFTREDLEKALPTIHSMITRSEKTRQKFAEGTSQASLARNRIKALQIAAALITRELEGDHSAPDFTKEDFEKALAPITSTIRKCEKARETLKEGTPQSNLARKMLHALYLSLALITRERNQ